MTVFENVLVGATMGGARSGSTAEDFSVDVLRLTGLLALGNHLAEELGLLARKRLELARALATDPRVILLDEIAGGLTDAETVELVATVQEVRGRGVAVVWIEHIVHVLVQVCPTLVCMSAGKVLKAGTADEVLHDPQVIAAYLGAAAA
jgi:branched-chain amino acid transport system ATP-binding protein